MGLTRMFTVFLLTLSVYLLLLHRQQVLCAPSVGSINADTAHRVRNRPIARFAARPIKEYIRIKPENLGEFLVDDDDLIEFSKRQTSDDYGHLRFGKRGEDFDDYGHMRFGRSGGDK